MLFIKKEINPLDKKVVDNIRGLGIDIISEAKSGHPGVTLGAAPILTSLYLNHMKYDTNNPKWINRDRFVLSCGHASALLYSVLHMSGFDISLDDLKAFRKLNSKTPGHPEYNVTPGVDASTGPLGQGIANAVGMAISERYLSSLFNKKIIDYFTYVLCGDGDLMEGISYEACSLAGKLKLNKLILLYDSNDVTLDGKREDAFDENIKERFESMNWNYILVSDSEDLNSIDDAINEAKNSTKPTIIEIKSIIGKYSLLEGTNEVHGKPLSLEDITNIKEKLGLRDVPFQVSEEASAHFKEKADSRNVAEIDKWVKDVLSLNKEEKELLDLINDNKNSVKLKDLYYELPTSEESLRVTSGKIINSISNSYKLVIGGSADVSSSTMIKFEGNKNIMFGVREHAMGGIANGIALCGLTPVVSTFLSFSDYMKPSIRLAAMMDLSVIYVFTHDSISVGEDGPTHQPVEQLISLRSIPNVDVYRPSDANEVLGSYKNIFETRKPSIVILNRNKVPTISTTNVNEVKNGAYIVKKENKEIECILLSSGEDLKLALDVSDKLQEKGIDTRVVSVPSIEVFENNIDNYKCNIIPKIDNTFVIEKSSSYSWYNYVTDKSHLFTMDTFGKSGNYIELENEYNFNVEYIEKTIEELVK